MASRLELQTLLEEILGSRNVYFQPPPSVQMKYPAIRYALSNIDLSHANNDVYKHDTSYELTLIDYDPDSPIVNKLIHLPKCRFGRPYTAEGLNHWTFTLFY